MLERVPWLMRDKRPPLNAKDMTNEPSNLANAKGPDKLGVIPYALAAMSIFPGLGLPFGVIALIWGLATFRRGGKLLTAIAGASVLWQLVAWGLLIRLPALLGSS
jgi:hypothetical protein